MIVQYIKSNQVGLQKIKVGPYPFIVNSGRRVTQENVPVTFTLPQHVVLNTPNKITATDFENWVQERSTYQAENVDAHFEMPLAMSDTDGASTIATDSGIPARRAASTTLSRPAFCPSGT